MEKFSRLAPSTQGSLPPEGTKLMEEPSETLESAPSSEKTLCTQREIRKG